MVICERGAVKNSKFQKQPQTNSHRRFSFWLLNRLKDAGYSGLFKKFVG